LAGRTDADHSASDKKSAQRNLPEVGPGELTPSALLWGNAAGAAEAENSCHYPGNTQGNKSTTKCIHVGLAGIEPATFTLSV
jgi:hypothetical protein